MLHFIVKKIHLQKFSFIFLAMKIPPLKENVTEYEL